MRSMAAASEAGEASRASKIGAGGVAPLASARGGGWRDGASLVVMSASGFAGLGYQIVWTQQSALFLGHESAAVLAVITAFFGGLALGSFAFGPRIEKSTRPARWYAGCEIVIALWGIALALILPTFSGWMLKLTGAQPSALWQWSVAFCGTFVLLLPATAAMGATLPAMERVTVHLREGERSIAALYASNTFGAVIGVLATAFWLIPALGLVATFGEHGLYVCDVAGGLSRGDCYWGSGLQALGREA
jgi:spermidine synthase